MTARFDAFKQALEALCVAHGVTLQSNGMSIDVFNAEDDATPIYKGNRLGDYTDE